MNVTVVGLGKIGLPLAVQIASRGHRVVGADIDPGVVELVLAGRVPFPGEADLPERLVAVVKEGTLTATVDTESAVATSDVVIVVVPLVVDDEGSPRFDAMDAATASVAAALEPGTLVSYETTLPVGTTRGRFLSALEAGSGLSAGIDFFVCHSPERVFSGRIFQDLRRYPKLIGGIDDASSERAIAFYESALEFDVRKDLARPNGVWDLGSAEAAELAKLAETTYRDLNIAFANEIARYCDDLGVSASLVIDAANSQPFSHIHRPGVAVGGHCIPVYPHFMLGGAPNMRLPSIAREINTAMPAYAVEKLAGLLGGLTGKTVAVLGAAYRGGVKETAFSGVFGVVDAIDRAGGRPVVEDPLFSDEELTSLGFTPHHLGEHADGAILQADHMEYFSLAVKDLPGVHAIVDGRGVIDHSSFANSEITIVTLGEGG